MGSLLNLLLKVGAEPEAPEVEGTGDGTRAGTFLVIETGD